MSILCRIFGHWWEYKSAEGSGYPPMIERKTCRFCGATIKMWPPPAPLHP